LGAAQANDAKFFLALFLLTCVKKINKFYSVPMAKTWCIGGPFQYKSPDGVEKLDAFRRVLFHFASFHGLVDDERWWNAYSIAEDFYWTYFC
jgi:hypothetical protein